jgi:MYXO-CTERM domain-containing protein
MKCFQGWLATLAVASIVGVATLDTPALASDPPPSEDLPPGIHLGSSGRYTQDVCDRSLPSYCLSRRLLPEGFDPRSVRKAPPPRPLFGGQFCVPMTGGGGGGSSPAMGAMTPADVVAAYALSASTGAHGQIVAIIDMPDSTAFSDLNTYRSAFGLGALPQCANGLPDGKTPCFAQVDASGNPNSTSLDCPGADPETGLDSEMVSASCPDCSILLVQMTNATNGPSYSDFIQGVQTAANLGAVVTSISFGIPEQGGEEATGYTTAGHLVLAASGDSGYENILDPQIGGHSPSYPASAPDVLGIGGTTLAGLGGSSYGEKVWNDGQGGATGSGCSTEFPMPGFQTTFLASHAGAFGMCTLRDSVDLSAAAEFVPFGALHPEGIAEYDSQGQWSQVVGTSAASPMVAGILTRLGLAVTISNDLGFPYEHLAAFNDVTVGDNLVGNTCSDDSCTAGPGWDGPTGVGTPNGAMLAPLGTSSSGGSGSGGSGGGSGGGDGGSANDTTAKAGCGCALPGAASTGNGALALLVVAAALGVRGRRRRA